jgi:gliding motility-associated-like protein
VKKVFTFLLVIFCVFLQAQNQGYTKPHSCMDEGTPSLYNWQDIEAKFSKRLHISIVECKNFFKYAAKWDYLKMNTYFSLVKEGRITKINAQQYWLDKLSYFEDIYKFKYLADIQKERLEIERNSTANKTASSSCNNLDFTSGTINWQGQWNNGPSLGGGLASYGILNITGLNSSGLNSMGYVHEICTGGIDRNVPINVVPPGHTRSLRLGDDSAYIQNITSGPSYPYNHQIISNTFSVTPSSQTITYWYAVALSQSTSAPHVQTEQPFFKIRMYDQNGTEIICARYDVDATTASSIGGFQSLIDPIGNNEFLYKDWSQVLIPLLNYVGQTVTITFETCDCANGGHFGYAYLAVDCAPLAVVNTLPQPCVGGNTTMTAPAGLATYSWSGPGIVGANNGQIATANVGGTYSVTMTTFANQGQTGCSLTIPTSFTNSTIAPVASFSATTPCLNNNTQFTDGSTLLPNQGTISAWSWDFGDGNTSTSHNPTHLYTAAGTYPVTYTITSSVNCTATYSTLVTVNPLPTSSFSDAPVCKGIATNFVNSSVGAASYNWNFGDGTVASTIANPTHLYANAGTYTASLTTVNSFSCNSVSTNTVLVNTNGVASFNTVSVCLGTGSNFTNTSTPNTGVTYSWNFGDAANTADTSSLQSPSYTYPIDGTYSVTLTITSSSGCISSKTNTVTVKPIPQVAVNSPAPFCWNDLVVSPSLTNTPSNSNITYSWTNSNTLIGLPLSNGVGVPPNFLAGSNNSTTNITSVISITPSLNGCTGLPQNYTITVKPTPIITYTNISVCPGDVVPNLTLTPIPSAANISWSTSTSPYIGLSTTSGNNLIPSFTAVNQASAAQSNLITLNVTLNGCAGPTTTFSITVNSNPKAKFRYSSACDGNNTLFFDESNPGSSPIAQWNWNFGSGTSAASHPSFLLTPVGIHTVSLEVTTAAGCKSDTTENVFVNPSATVDFFADSVSCTPLKTTFINVVSMPVKTWNWNFGNTSIATYTTQTAAQQTYTNGSHTQNSYFTVSLSVVTDSGCVSKVTKNNYITVYPKPYAAFVWKPKDADIIEPVIYFQDQSIGASGANAYYWSFGDMYETVDSLNNSTIANPKHTYSDQIAGEYDVKQLIENSYGCKDSITEIVLIKDAVTFYIPNAFTPNNDGRNEGFKGTGIGIKNSTYNMWVYDRWGSMIFHSTDLETAWDGYVSGKRVQEDVYIWKVKFEDDLNRQHDYHGTVTLLK